MSLKLQQGFTLLELMVALAIFAMLAMTGWQIMDSLTKSRDRAKTQIKAISDLQFAYLQLSQDLSQTNNYVAIPIGLSQADSLPPPIRPTFRLNSQGIEFKRFTMPDPRYEQSANLTQVGYAVVEDKLIKSQWGSIQPRPNENAQTSVLLAGITQAKWTALTPASMSEFPDRATLQKVKSNTAIANSPTNPNQPNGQSNGQSPNTAPTLDMTPYQQLPKGIRLEFVYQDEPITWQFALPNQAPNAVIASTINSTSSNPLSSPKGSNN